MTRRKADRRTQILDCIADSVRHRGYPPSVREIAAVVGLASTSPVQYHIDALVTDGVLERTATLSRSLRIVGDPCPHCGGTGVVAL